MTRYVLQMRHSPVILERLLDQIPADRYHERFNEDRFDLVETVAHLADFEEVFQDRMRLALKSPGATVLGLDPDARAAEKNYAAKDIHHELGVYASRRRDTVTLLEEATPEEWTRTVQHSEFGELSLYDLAAIILGHDTYHFERVSEYFTFLHQTEP
jgi:uncharacterized damage-inducible protein DinB